LLGASGRDVADVEVIADEVEEGLITDECPGGEYGSPVTVGIVLGDHFEPSWTAVDGGKESRFVSGTDDDGDLVGSGRQGLVHDDAERRTDDAVTIDEPLERMFLRGLSGCGDHGAAEIHGGSVGMAEKFTKNRPPWAKKQPPL
jgi:hypothetical protein